MCIPTGDKNSKCKEFTIFKNEYLFFSLKPPRNYISESEEDLENLERSK